MNKAIQNLIQKQKRKIIGLQSGTSCNGVELALLEISGSGITAEFEVLYTYRHSYSPQQKQFLLQVLDLQHSNIKVVSQANFYLARIWAETIQEMLAQCEHAAESIDLIGSQGPTIYHQPQVVNCLGHEVSSTLQIGDPAVLAQLTGITTIGDFSGADMAAGGRGAPLLPYLDWLFLSRLKKNVLVLNIDSITSCTYIPADGDKSKVLAFDIGPGNMLIDQFMQRLYELPFDRDGAKAGLGILSEKLFACLQKIDTFTAQAPPKCLSREQYGPDFVLSILRKSLRWRIPEPDVIHTISRYIAFTAWKACHDILPQDVQEVLISGSGSHNSFLTQICQEYFKQVPVKRISNYGLQEDFKEAICSAILANECIQGIPANLPGVTGAKKPVILGKICMVNKSVV